MWKRRTGEPVLNAVEARQGFLDRPMLLVLIASTILVCLAFGVAWLATCGDDAPAFSRTR